MKQNKNVSRGTLKTNEMKKKILKSVGTFLFCTSYVLVVVSVLYGLCMAVQSCSMYRQTDISGHTTIVTTDTTHINHNTLLKYQKK